MHIYIYIYAWSCVCVHVWHTSEYVRMLYVYMYMYVYIFMYMYGVCVYICMHMCVSVSVRVRVVHILRYIMLILNTNFRIRYNWLLYNGFKTPMFVLTLLLQLLQVLHAVGQIIAFIVLDYATSYITTL